MSTIPRPGGKFRIVARQGDEWWGIRVRELDWVFSQARCLEEVAETARDAIAAYFDVPASEVGEIVLDRVIPAEVVSARGTAPATSE